MDKEEIINKLLNGEIRLYQIDKFTENATEALDIRREFIEKQCNCELNQIANYTLDMEMAMAKKTAGIERGRSLNGVQQEDKYIAIQYLNKTERYPIEKLCGKLHLSRAGYYKWMKRAPSQSQLVNEQLVEWIKAYYEEQDGILGYRQMTITINREKETHFNKKRIRRLMQILHLKSVCRRAKNNYIKSTPEVTAENILNRDFTADAPNEKWLTDVTEFKYYVGVEVKKIKQTKEVLKFLGLKDEDEIKLAKENLIKERKSEIREHVSIKDIEEEDGMKTQDRPSLHAKEKVASKKTDELGNKINK